MAQHIKYSILSSDLPYYINFDEEKSNVLKGKIQLTTADTRRPVWNTPEGNLGVIEEGVTNHNIPLSATLGIDGYGSISYFLLDDNEKLPLGLKLDKSGTITGVLKETPFVSDKPIGFLDSELPKWVTTSGYIDTVHEGDSFATTLQANFGSTSTATIMKYHLTKGSLPLGFKLKTNGELDGTVRGVSILPNDEYVDLLADKKPRWNTLGGTVAKVGEKESINLNLSATIRSGATSLRYYVIDGSLPFGIKVKSNGELSGITGEEQNPNDIVTTSGDIFKPTINTSSLGSLAQSQTVNIQLSATAHDGRTIDRFYVTDQHGNGELPFGLKLNKSGLITGTVDIKNQVGTYTLMLAVVDNTGNFSTKVLNYTITE